MHLHTPTGWVVTPLPTYCNEAKTKELPKRSSIKRIVAAFLQLAGYTIEPIERQTPRPGFPPRNTPRSNVEAMIACFRAGESWQDGMDQPEKEALNSGQDPFD